MNTDSTREGATAEIINRVVNGEEFKFMIGAKGALDQRRLENFKLYLAQHPGIVVVSLRFKYDGSLELTLRTIPEKLRLNERTLIAGMIQDLKLPITSVI